MSTLSASEANRLARALKGALRKKGISQIKAAADLGIHQSQISRILNGQARRTSKNVRRLCTYANIHCAPRIADPASNAALMRALQRVWDGSRESANAVIRLLNAAESIGRSSPEAQGDLD